MKAEECAPDIGLARKRLRGEMKCLRAGMGPALRAQLSREACAHMRRLLETLGARRVMAYASIGDELDTWELMAGMLSGGIRVYLPRVLDGSRMAALEVTELSALERGVFGVMTPRLAGEQARDTPELDAVIVPGLGFDCAGYRLGYGGGYYDRFLPGINAPAISLAFGCQVLDTLPRAAWDVPVNIIVTETGARFIRE